MGMSTEALLHHFGGTDSEDYGYSYGPRQPYSVPASVVQVHP